MEYKNIIVKKEYGILNIRLNRPEVLNALTLEMKEELIDALQKSEKDEGIRVILLSGEGRSFCAGGDINRMGNTTTIDTFDYLGISKKLILLMGQIKKPIVAAVHGHAAGEEQV